MKKIALWHRYGPAGHTATCFAIPRIIQMLHERGFEVHYFGMREDSPPPETISENCTIHYVPFRIKRNSIINKLCATILWYMALPWIALRCRRLKIDAVWWDETLPFGAWLALTFFGQNVAISIADFFLNIYTEKRPVFRRIFDALQRLDSKSWRRLPLIVVKVNYTRTFLETCGVRPERVVCSGEPCDTQHYSPDDNPLRHREQYGLKETDFVLMHHGILHPNKGNDRIIRAIADLKTRIPDLRFLLVGDGVEMSRLKLLCKELQLTKQVVFTGWLPVEGNPEHGLVNAIRTADVGLVMRIGQFSDHFHVTNTLVHVMSCGLPVLAARLMGIAEIVEENVHGFLFDPDDMDTFKARLIQLYESEEMRQRMGQRAREKAIHEFDIERLATNVTNALCLLAENHYR